MLVAIDGGQIASDTTMLLTASNTLALCCTSKFWIRPSVVDLGNLDFFCPVLGASSTSLTGKTSHLGQVRRCDTAIERAGAVLVVQAQGRGRRENEQDRSERFRSVWSAR